MLMLILANTEMTVQHQIKPLRDDRMINIHESLQKTLIFDTTQMLRLLTLTQVIYIEWMLNIRTLRRQDILLGETI